MSGGVRRRRTSGITSSSAGDGTVIKYSAIGLALSSGAAGSTYYTRKYIPGDGSSLANSIGPNLAGYYATGKFMPGTKIRWEPSVSFTTTGRVFVAFTDNPEVMANLDGLTVAQLQTAVRGMSNVISFPVWQETDIPFPNKLRRKRFDANINFSSDVNVYDRSCQQYMLVVVEAMPASTAAGAFWFHDVVDVEGISSIVT